MQTARRKFLKYSSILGLMSLPGFSLFAKEPQFAVESLGSTHMDEDFDPEGWL
jgi:hypothetical protein